MPRRRSSRGAWNFKKGYQSKVNDVIVPAALADSESDSKAAATEQPQKKIRLAGTEDKELLSESVALPSTTARKGK